ncbi:hypothetical protein OEZ86_006009 [Tetradesmus obliquus]|nr:hypothetical protein OEZ86_006009 [Tetradesmus obliquus]
MRVAIEGVRQHRPAEDLCLQPLTQLTRVEIDDPDYFPAAATTPFSALQQLQRLVFKSNMAPAERAARLLAELPASLTFLEFVYSGKQQLGLSRVPAISSLTALHTLRIRRWGIDEEVFEDEAAAATGGLDPLLLARMQQLQVLELGWLGRDALPALLQVMPQLSSLRQLGLQCEALAALPASDAARYSDLLPASQHLSKLVLRSTASMLHDPRYGCHLFAGRQLPRLQQLVFGWDPTAGDEPVEEEDDLPPPFLDEAALQAMTACCPALRRLLLPGCVTEDAQLAPLLQLTALTALLTDEGVGQLTALTGLRSLLMRDCGISKELGDPDDEGTLNLSYQKPTGKTVAQQLRRRCRRAALLAVLEAEEEGGSMEAPGALQALLAADCGCCHELREQLEAAQARADATEAALRGFAVEFKELVEKIKRDAAAKRAGDQQQR